MLTHPLLVSGSPLEVPNPDDFERTPLRPRYSRATGLLHFHSWPLFTGAGHLTTVPDRPAALFLGKLYPLPLAYPDVPPELARYLGLSLISRRSHYLNLHAQLQHSGLQSPGTLLEYGLWMRQDAIKLEQRIWRWVQCPPDRSTRSHWLFGDGRSERLPSVYWEGVQNVPVHRLLWTTMRPMDLLGDDDRPRRVWDACPRDVLPHCVNPFHYEYALQRVHAPNPKGRQGQWEHNQQRFRHIVKRWDMVPNDETGIQQAVCPLSRKPYASIETQALAAADKLVGRRVHCDHCYAIYTSQVTRVARDGRPLRDHAGRTPQLPTLHEISTRASAEERRLKFEMEKDRVVEEMLREADEYAAKQHALNAGTEDE